jgi:hypothetical protein
MSTSQEHFQYISGAIPMSANEMLTLPQAPSADQLPPDMRDAVSRYRVELEGGRTLLLTLRHGRLSIEEGAGEADCVLTCPLELFHHALSGEVNLMTAFMRGDLAMSGDLVAAKRLYRYLRLSRTRGEHP